MPLDIQFDKDFLSQCHLEAKSAARRFSLPFRQNVWRGSSGALLGVGVGSSIDFQDHRPYVPGDDPRHIDWRAYARSNQYIMKLYRAETSPKTDVIIDASASMLINEAKSKRFFELVYFTIESVSRFAASARIYLFSRGRPRPLDMRQLLQRQLDRSLWEQASTGPDLSQVPLRSGSLTVVISDLLFECDWERCLCPIGRARNMGILFVPFASEEAGPPWKGTLELADCESAYRRKQRITPQLLQRYAEAYGRHFTFWREQCKKHGVRMARIGAEDDLGKALQKEALSSGAVEML
jgi:uncharacterized protein (DUF58 family)